MLYPEEFCPRHFWGEIRERGKFGSIRKGEERLVKIESKRIKYENLFELNRNVDDLPRYISRPIREDNVVRYKFLSQGCNILLILRAGGCC